ncbi:MAG: helix-turn-helix domain-containing protein [Alistipes sp.]|jgi:transcriptional regulator with XRE-family HTH domain|nr:helix-turn-helix domain-containing protein [Alistipes sp.]
MFDLKGFRKARKMSQKQISEILGIGTSFISQIETGKDPMPGYIPEKLVDAYGKEEVEKYYRESFASFDADRLGRKKYLFPTSPYLPSKKFNDTDTDTLDPISPEETAKVDCELIDRVLFALERRDELAFQQQREYERQGARIDELLTYLKARD